MQYTHLGRTGLLVSRLCLGTMNFASLVRPSFSNLSFMTLVSSALWIFSISATLVESLTVVIVEGTKPASTRGTAPGKKKITTRQHTAFLMSSFFILPSCPLWNCPD